MEQGTSIQHMINMAVHISGVRNDDYIKGLGQPVGSAVRAQCS